LARIVAERYYTIAERAIMRRQEALYFGDRPCRLLRPGGGCGADGSACDCDRDQSTMSTPATAWLAR